MNKLQRREFLGSCLALMLPVGKIDKPLELVWIGPIGPPEPVKLKPPQIYEYFAEITVRFWDGTSMTFVVDETDAKYWFEYAIKQVGHEIKSCSWIRKASAVLK